MIKNSVIAYSLLAESVHAISMSLVPATTTTKDLVKVARSIDDDVSISLVHAASKSLCALSNRCTTDLKQKWKPSPTDALEQDLIGRKIDPTLLTLLEHFCAKLEDGIIFLLHFAPFVLISLKTSSTV